MRPNDSYKVQNLTHAVYIYIYIYIYIERERERDRVNQEQNIK